MHECIQCGRMCDCDGEDMFYPSAPDDCDCAAEDEDEQTWMDCDDKADAEVNAIRAKRFH